MCISCISILVLAAVVNGNDKQTTSHEQNGGCANSREKESVVVKRRSSSRHPLKPQKKNRTIIILEFQSHKTPGGPCTLQSCNRPGLGQLCDLDAFGFQHGGVELHAAPTSVTDTVQEAPWKPLMPVVVSPGRPLLGIWGRAGAQKVEGMEATQTYTDKGGRQAQLRHGKRRSLGWGNVKLAGWMTRRALCLTEDLKKNQMQYGREVRVLLFAAASRPTLDGQ